MIFKELSEHPVDYLLLLVVAVAGLIVFTTPAVSFATKNLLALVLGFFYAGWGIWHHRQKNNLSVQVALEYVLMGSLMSIVLWLTLQY